ncbi:hypothetical protein C7420_101732 [Pantoea ananatis]|nr:hypothetical protein [Pantoea ananatis]MDR6089820.1 hypothetical protein [Pantoea ananatis]PWV67336.1 hypothetical protein C7425_103383 [Pantoea ananatis]RAR75116.1 hypothetical protein C7420_101732 [Pantoea ananatis]
MSNVFIALALPLRGDSLRQVVQMSQPGRYSAARL